MQKQFEDRKKKLEHVKNWIFDLDDTLYSSEENIFSQIEQKIRDYIMDLMKVDYDQAYYLQKNYYQKYGATLRGLILEEKIDPEDFLEKAHAIDLTDLQENQPLIEALRTLQGRKFIFTNGSRKHAENITKKLNIHGSFDGFYGISEGKYIPKPSLEAFKNMLDFFKLDPKESAMVDDSQRNLVAAHELGMTTVWINSNKRDNPFTMLHDNPSFCDFQAADVASFVGCFNLEPCRL